MSGLEALEYWVFEAVERDKQNKSFTDDEVMSLFGSMEKVFGSKNAIEFVDEVKANLKAYGGGEDENENNTFNRVVVRTLANSMAKAEAEYEEEQNKGK